MPLFFVLSGFVIHYSYSKSNNKSWETFFTRRFFRLYPAYLLALAVAFVIANRTMHIGSPIRDLLFHIFLIHNFFNSTIYSVNPAMWSLATEIQLYLLYPLMLFATSKLGFDRFIKVLFVVTAIAYLVLIISNRGIDTPNPALWRNTGLLWFQWVLGAYLAECYLNSKRLFHHPKTWTGILGPLIVIMSFMQPLSQFAYSCAALLFAVIIEAVLSTTNKPPKSLKFLGNLGICSYSFYLWHQPLLQILLRRLEPLKIENEAVKTGALVILALVVIGPMSWGLYRFVEQPFQAIGKKLTAK